MGQLRFETLTMPAAALGEPNPLPALREPGKERFAREDVAAAMEASNTRKADKPDPNDPAIRYGGIYGLPDCLPYAVLDGFDRDRQPRAFKTAVLENDILKATFLLEIGGRMWSLIHKPSGKSLVDANYCFQPTMLSRRGAWISGGCEWNATPGGHSPHNVDHLFAGTLETDDGEPVLRLYEWERAGKIAYQIDCWLPDGSEFLFARVRIVNPTNETIPMYWWTNIAVDELDDHRVIVPTDDAISWGYTGKAETVPIPIVNGRDVSWPTNLPGCCDFYFGTPTSPWPWIAYLNREGRGLIHASTSRLVGRKLFTWGMNPGGRNWQEFLSPGGPPYIELQAGLMQTQYTSNAMPAQADWTWVEAFGLVEADGAIVHGDDWQAAYGNVGEALSGMITKERLEEMLVETEAMADRQAETIMHRGSGWGALEQRRREAAGEPAGWPAALVFDDESLGEKQAPWLGLLETGAMPVPQTDEPVPSFMVQQEWQDLLEASVHTGAGNNWYAWLQLGVLRYTTADSAEQAQAGVEAWERSLELKETAWAHRNIAAAAWYAGNRDEAANRWLKAWQLRCSDIRLARETAQALVRTGRGNEFLAMLEAMPPAIHDDARLQMLRVMCLLESNDPAHWDEIEAFLARPAEPADMHEGEPTLSRMFYELKARQRAAAENRDVTEDDRAHVRDTLTVPAHLDYRQLGDSAFKKDK